MTSLIDSPTAIQQLYHLIAILLTYSQIKKCRVESAHCSKCLTRLISMIGTFRLWLVDRWFGAPLSARLIVFWYVWARCVRIDAHFSGACSVLVRSNVLLTHQTSQEVRGSQVHKTIYQLCLLSNLCGINSNRRYQCSGWSILLTTAICLRINVLT